MNKAYRTYFLSFFTVVLASVMLVSCSVDDDTQGNKTMVSDYTANNVTMKNGYWVVDGSDAGSCAVAQSALEICTAQHAVMLDGVLCLLGQRCGDDRTADALCRQGNGLFRDSLRGDGVPERLCAVLPQGPL